MEKLTGTAEKLIYASAETNFYIIAAKTNNEKYRKNATVIVSGFEVRKGMEFVAEGEWVKDARYGIQFKASFFSEALPTDEEGMIRYLGSGEIKGIGPKNAEKIVEKFGDKTFEIIEKDIERLKEISGIGDVRIEKIRNSWEKQREIRKIIFFFAKYGISTTFAGRIYNRYKEKTIEIITKNPYRLADDIWGIGFLKADEIGKKLGFAKNSPVRLQSGILYTLSNFSAEGSVYAKEKDLKTKAMKLLECAPEEVEEQLEELIDGKKVIKEENAIYLPPLYRAEKESAEILSDIYQDVFFSPQKDSDIERFIESGDVHYSSEQKEAVITAMKSKVMVLTGGPGAGKSTTLLGILNALNQSGLRVLLAAPTGRAAKRMSEATGEPASTIHRLIGMSPDGTPVHNEENPIEGDVLILDECSMIDIRLFHMLLRAVPRHMRLIFVGDTDQLPSVGAGSVLNDIIESGCFPVVHLTQIFRQAKESSIIQNAHRINNGEELVFPECSFNSDFVLIKENDPEKTANLIKEFVTDIIPEKTGYTAEDVQILTPMKKSAAGTENLNRVLQDSLNKSDIRLQKGSREFRLHDKVMQIQNNYDKGVFNGDIGYITAINLEDRELTVTFDGIEATYDADDLDELLHAYAITVHRSQGAEYPVVIMPLITSFYIMLQRNLFYTGVTRAKKLFILIGDDYAIKKAIKTKSAEKRNSKLAARLKQHTIP